mmetsp:Transcript_16340/g.35303  ORF Transcript_16340/g.35303 Transcript_16340/m.35303 type:complete len:205 (+) Transcript_16340:116-730(+)
MKRHTSTNGQRNHDGQLSAAARAAMARAAGQSDIGTAARSSYATPRRNIRSVVYRIIYGSVISGNPTQQNDKALTLFRRSLIGCALCIYIPLMCIGYTLVTYGSTPRNFAAAVNLQANTTTPGVPGAVNLQANATTTVDPGAVNLQANATTPGVPAAVNQSQTDITEGESRRPPSSLEGHEKTHNEGGETQNAGQMDNDPPRPG